MDAIDADTSRALTNLEMQKITLECQRLEQEINHASLAWWKRPVYLAGLAPILLALISFLSAWATGYFDKQRATLDQEIGELKSQQVLLQSTNQNLERSRLEIESAIKETQQQIDQVYLSLKITSAEASYALSHFKSLGPLMTAEERQNIESILSNLPADDVDILRKLFDAYELMATIVPITEQELVATDAVIQELPATPDIKKLSPIIGPVRVLVSPDGRFFNPEDGKYYDELEQIGPSSDTR